MPISTITQPQVAPLLKPRTTDSHKGMFGSVWVIGGGSGMVGAALLAGRAALKMGAGCVHIGLLASDAPSVDFVQPELMLHRIEQGLPAVGDVLAIGCGMGVSAHAQRLLHDALWLDAPLVLDADALNLIAAHTDLATLLRERTAATVLTPHPGEAAHLLACRTADIQSDRPAAARRLAEKFRCTVALKGATSLVSSEDGTLYQNTTGNPGMSAPGMGDVLAGMIAAFLAQGVATTDAAKLAVYLHGAAGDALAEFGVKLGMTASELTDSARHVLNQWQTK
ncbi:Bifunctional NAD(P)H-hydrate repair enzyme Nnr [Ferriphaselus amnicola]|uniref:ADP-dependent (S)-NAD(P)H-hydrate dehydratase n=1 Tax=Ferriphaselus amnicola TaxID=1188319 RepID=A0A2Z6GCW7_9PROT|nr:NAD(P)H-hydrate dehydratase [Ferriphaselus amnicola]BBE51471.1 Bifunctional NAD(P)H-hydrate repair enzyme Nnr [Ferriphaselus amnicola]